MAPRFVLRVRVDHTPARRTAARRETPALRPERQRAGREPRRPHLAHRERSLRRGRFMRPRVLARAGRWSRTPGGRSAERSLSRARRAGPIGAAADQLRLLARPANDLRRFALGLG
jgi:hypothetical protein